MARTGPRSTAGKAAVARNALRLGIYARPETIVDHEAPGDWQRFRDALVADLAPADPVALALSQRVASALWRLRRVPAAERIALQPPAGCDTSLDAARLMSIMRAEARLTRQLFAALRELRTRQDRRAAEGAPLPRLHALARPTSRKANSEKQNARAGPPRAAPLPRTEK